MDIQWTGSVRDLVRTVASSDARTTYIDKSGAKIRINIDGGDFEETDEPFYIEYGENLYDARNRKEAAMILSNIRRGEKYPDMPSSPGRQVLPPTVTGPASLKKWAKSKAKSKRRQNNPTSVRGVRG